LHIVFKNYLCGLCAACAIGYCKFASAGRVTPRQASQYSGTLLGDAIEHSGSLHRCVSKQPRNEAHVALLSLHCAVPGPLSSRFQPACCLLLFFSSASRFLPDLIHIEFSTCTFSAWRTRLQVTPNDATHFLISHCVFPTRWALRAEILAYIRVQ
jgi:hypothetical protein